VSHGGVYSRGRVGRRLYMYQTAAKKAILSQFSDQWVREVLDRYGLPKATTHTVDDEATLFDELPAIRERGVAFDSEESTEGLRLVAAPVTGPDGDVLGAFAVAGPTPRITGERFETEIPDLVRSVVNGTEPRVRLRADERVCRRSVTNPSGPRVPRRGCRVRSR
jgi:DNA-binding IclR family transcriptional regulator